MAKSSDCCDKNLVKKGPWTTEEDQKLIDYIQKHGHGRWRTLPKNAGLKRCGKSCRLRWTNYLRPDIKRGKVSVEEEDTIIQLHSVLGNKWSTIAARLPGRTDNEIKNYWNTHIKKKLLRMGIDPVTHKPRLDLLHLYSLLNQFNTSSFNGNTGPILSPNLMNLAQSLTNQAQTKNQSFQSPIQDQSMQTNLDQFYGSSWQANGDVQNQDYTSQQQVMGNNCFENFGNLMSFSSLLSSTTPSCSSVTPLPSIEEERDSYSSSHLLMFNNNNVPTTGLDSNGLM